jgi:hypothetical protein
MTDKTVKCSNCKDEIRYGIAYHLSIPGPKKRRIIRNYCKICGNIIFHAVN